MIIVPVGSSSLQETIKNSESNVNIYKLLIFIDLKLVVIKINYCSPHFEDIPPQVNPKYLVE